MQGVPVSWDPAVATIKCSHSASHATWSPCSRFIAIALNSDAGIQILDSATLKHLKSFLPTHTYTQLLTFSPDGHLLTWVSRTSEVFISWDVQTGLLASKISITEEGSMAAIHSITYSGCGTMLGVLFQNHNISTISTYNVLSGTPIHSHPVEGLLAGTIWTCGECVQFAVLGSSSITIWEVGFTSKQSPTEVKSLLIPTNFDPSKQFHFLPTHSRLAFLLEGAVTVWDAQLSKPLLNSVDVEMTKNMTFSPDGHFFACETSGPEIYLWKESPAGYTLHQKLPSGRGSVTPLLSPNGQLIVGVNNSTIQLWHTTSLTTPLSNTPIQLSWFPRQFLLGFSPDGSFAATARLEDNLATVLDLKSGAPQLTIDAGTNIYSLRIAESTIAVVGDREILTWNLPVGGHVLGPWVDTNDSVRTIAFARSTSPTVSQTDHTPPTLSQIYSASISPDFEHIIVIAGDSAVSMVHFIIFDTATGKYLAGARHSLSMRWGMPWFTQDGSEVWYHDLRRDDGWDYGRQSHKLERGWAVVRDSNSNIIKLSNFAPLQHTHHPSRIPPWQSSDGHQVTDDGWILNSGGKRLLLLPYHWQSSERAHRMWGGQFLALLHCELQEAVILELLEG